jgi:hypothetical protein
MAPRKTAGTIETECADPRVAAQIATLMTKVDALEENVDSLKVYLKEEYNRMVFKQLEDQEKRMHALELRIGALETFRDKIMRKIYMVMGGFTVLMFLLQVAVQVALKYIK